MLKVVQHKKIYIGIAAILVVASIVSLLIQGFSLDTDFAGGTSITYTIEKTASEDEVRVLAKEAFGKEPSMVRVTGNTIDIEVGHDQKLSDKENQEKASAAVEKLNYEIAKKWGKLYPIVDENGMQLITEETAEAKTVKEGTETKLATEITPDQSNKQVISHGGYAYFVEGVSKSELNVVSASTARNLASSAIWMSVLAAILILIYISIRFELTSGVCAVVALAHDIIVLCGIYSILRIKIDTNFIAALLTVLGYSINNTIVIFDRIRENTRKAKKETYAQIANESINQTLRRSINTTITTLLTIGAVYVLGVTSIKVFALPIIIGIVVGTYSSIFVSGSIWAMWRDAAVKSKKKK